MKRLFHSWFIPRELIPREDVAQKSVPWGSPTEICLQGSPTEICPQGFARREFSNGDLSRRNGSLARRLLAAPPASGAGLPGLSSASGTRGQRSGEISLRCPDCPIHAAGLLAERLPAKCLLAKCLLAKRLPAARLLGLQRSPSLRWPLFPGWPSSRPRALHR